jgi:2-polyprenyl-3-methyl-5-hydroxy-6-metoxy-1,4-benzoquinol methylase
MDCCQCRGIESQFNQAEAERKLREYRRRGPARTTRILLDALMAEHIQGLTLLDIGGGVGAIQHALLKAGVSRAVDVDASSAYLSAAKTEATRLGHADRVGYQHGNFVDVADSIPPAGIVTLDRVICCYHDMPALVDRSAAKAARLYGLVYPRDVWWVRAGVRAANAMLWMERTTFRIFAHSRIAIDAVVRRNGLERIFTRDAGLWQVVIYARHKEQSAATPRLQERKV